MSRQPNSKRIILQPPVGIANSYKVKLVDIMDHVNGMLLEEVDKQLSGVFSVGRQDSVFSAEKIRALMLKYAQSKGSVLAAEIFNRVDVRNIEQLRTSLNVNDFSFSRAVTADRFARENVAFIKNITASTAESVEAVVSDSFRRGLSRRDLSERIKERMDVSEARARLIARDQTLKLNASMNEQRLGEIGITKYRWITSLDERVREVHKELGSGNKVYEFKNPPLVDIKRNRHCNPGQDYQCRCTASPVLRE